MKEKRVFVLFFLIIISYRAFAGHKRSGVYHEGGLYNDCYAIITYNNINVRSEPNSKSDILFQLYTRDIVKVIEIYNKYMYAEGAYAKWVKISFDNRTGYVLSRWMTSFYGEVNKKSPEEIEYFAYEYYYEIPKYLEDCWEPEFLAENIINDNLFHLTQKDRIIIKKFTFIPEKGCLDSAPEVSLIKDTGIENFPVILFLCRIKYGSYISSKAFFYAWDDEKGLIEILSENALFEDSDNYRKSVISFPNKSYDLLNNKWESCNNNGQFFVTVENSCYDEDGNLKTSFDRYKAFSEKEDIIKNNKKYYVYLFEGVNLQEKPEGKKVVAHIKCNEQVSFIEESDVVSEIDGYNEPWIKVKTSNGDIGYVYGAYLSDSLEQAARFRTYEYLHKGGEWFEWWSQQLRSEGYNMEKYPSNTITSYDKKDTLSLIRGNLELILYPTINPDTGKEGWFLKDIRVYTNKCDYPNFLPFKLGDSIEKSNYLFGEPNGDFDYELNQKAYEAFGSFCIFEMHVFRIGNSIGSLLFRLTGW